jgi:hypothetical protein
MLGPGGALSDLARALGLLLFPSPTHDEIGASIYVHAVEAPFPDLASGAPGLELRHRRAVLQMGDDGKQTMWARQSSLRLYRDAEGAIVVDRLLVDDASFLGVHIRPELGEMFDVSLFTARREEVWAHGLTYHVSWRIFSPIALVPVGLSNTDQDTDGRLKFQVSALGGVGGEVLARIGGPVALLARAEGTARTAHRFATSTDDDVRHELGWFAEAGGGGVSGRQAWTVSAWAEHAAQWDPRDQSGKDGIDRQYLAAGVGVSTRMYRPPAKKPAPGLHIPEPGVSR